MPEIHLILDNIRSSYNVGSLLRSADGFGVTTVNTIGITPHMRVPGDDRLPHVIERAEREIKKTALGAESLLTHHFETARAAVDAFDSNEILLISIELTKDSTPLPTFTAPQAKSIGIILGHEITGVSDEMLDASLQILHIPMRGKKQSYNVAVAGAVAMYALTTKFATMYS